MAIFPKKANPHAETTCYSPFILSPLQRRVPA